jgi:hypothetical protein
MSVQMRCVFTILDAAPNLKVALSPFIDLSRETIYWERISKLQLSGGERTLVAWIYGLWTDEQRPRANVFDGSLNLPPQIQIAVLKALALRWGLAM